MNELLITSPVSIHNFYGKAQVLSSDVIESIGSDTEVSFKCLYRATLSKKSRWNHDL